MGGRLRLSRRNYKPVKKYSQREHIRPGPVFLVIVHHLILRREMKQSSLYCCIRKGSVNALLTDIKPIVSLGIYYY